MTVALRFCVIIGGWTADPPAFVNALNFSLHPTLRRAILKKGVVFIKKQNIFSVIFAGVTTLLVTGLLLFVFCPAVSLHNPGLWLLMAVVTLVFIAIQRTLAGNRDFLPVDKKKRAPAICRFRCYPV